MMWRVMLLLTTPLLLGACGILSSREPAPVAAKTQEDGAVPQRLTFPTPTKPAGTAKRGGYYLDDGPGDNPPSDLASIPDAVPTSAPLHRFANKPYNVFGRDYVPLAADQAYRARGIGSWYGRKFHGQKTSSGELYDMYGMTAAHPTLPIPSYVRVSNPANGKSVVVKVNDRGPFHADRLIDLSYTAAWKLGYVNNGSTLVEVEKLHPGSPATTIAERNDVPPVAAPSKPATTLATQRDSTGTYLQLGAFGNRDNAESFLAHMARELARDSTLPASEALESKLVIRTAGLWHRVQLGPWANAEAARGAAENLQRLLGNAPLIVSR